MSAATDTKTAKERATIAIRMMKSNTSGSFSRAFDDCFEMGDGGEVVLEIARRAMRNPTLLELVKQNRGVAWSSVEAAIKKLTLETAANKEANHTHTPTPWEIGTVIDGAEEYNECANVRGIQIRGQRTAIACLDDAAFIVRAVNSHDIMLETLRRIVASAPLTGLPLALEKDIQSACAAIAKAESVLSKDDGTEVK